MQPIDFHVAGWGSWPRADTAPVQIPTQLRRRVSPIGQHALAVAWGLDNLDHARFILSSRHGEFDRTLSLMESVIAGEESSPADFTLSVHHALAGLLSIVKGNRKGHIAVAAGAESFCFGLIEAAACLKENPSEPVILIHFDDLLPGPYAAFEEPGAKPIALALSLTAAGDGEHIQISMQPDNSTPPSVSHAENFVNFLNGKAATATSPSADRQWIWARSGTRHAPA